ncbi:hypothetical protein [Holospora curviuscula]|uniref:LTXXQ motif protein n=1 Tax=Holospora curviuscula TaxID=1082868 RepID=A0A2S5R926_9PROT|nr:hypothetical protein [Holospora curviuscula]PPE03635.1 hypothetical protein HCUR_00863 [Holospora curviuscula]
MFKKISVLFLMGAIHGIAEAVSFDELNNSFHVLLGHKNFPIPQEVKQRLLAQRTQTEQQVSNQSLPLSSTEKEKLIHDLHIETVKTATEYFFTEEQKKRFNKLLQNKKISDQQKEPMLTQLRNLMLPPPLSGQKIPAEISTEIDTVLSEMEKLHSSAIQEEKTKRVDEKVTKVVSNLKKLNELDDLTEEELKDLEDFDNVQNSNFYSDETLNRKNSTSSSTASERSNLSVKDQKVKEDLSTSLGQHHVLSEPLGIRVNKARSKGITPEEKKRLLNDLKTECSKKENKKIMEEYHKNSSKITEINRELEELKEKLNQDAVAKINMQIREKPKETKKLWAAFDALGKRNDALRETKQKLEQYIESNKEAIENHQGYAPCLEIIKSIESLPAPQENQPKKKTGTVAAYIKNLMSKPK